MTYSHAPHLSTGINFRLYRMSGSSRYVWPVRALLLAFAWCVALGSLTVSAQNVQYTNNRVDKTKRTSFRVDPSTLGLSIEIPIADFPGRAGAGLPIALNYSSKLWRMKYVQANDGAEGNTYSTWVAPTWGEHSAAGWTSTLGVPTIINDSQELFDSTGAPTQNCPNGCWIVRRVLMQMPDGSSHELRHTTPTAPLTSSLSGTYFASDGSGLRYEYDSKTLYLPDGSHYVLGSLNWPATTTTYTDRNGNTLTFDPSTNLWSDTLGRTIPLPPIPLTSPNFPGAGLAPGSYAYSIHGVGTTMMNYTFRWKALADALTDTSQQLAYPGDCSGILIFPPPPPAPSLFQSFGNDAACAETPGTIFNPSVLAEIVLPDNTSYKFTYNLYGEIEKVVYPSGGYERFVYDFIQPTDWVSGVYAETNRGVVDHFISPSGSGNDEEHWHYSASYLNGSNTQPYKVTITAPPPDSTYTERYLHTAGAVQNPWGFTDVRIGRAYDERSFSSTGQIMRRTLTQWDASPQGTYPNARDPRVSKRVEILLDTKTTNALTSTTSYQYDGDLNVTATNHNDFYQVSQDMGRDGAIGSIPAATLLRTDETTFLVNDPSIDSGTRDAYRQRNLIRLPSSSRVLDAGGTPKAQTEFKYDEYDESHFPLVTYGQVTSWVDPQTTVRGNPTTTRRWLDTAGTWLEIHTRYDQCGSVKFTWDARDTNRVNPTQIDYSSDFSFAYPTSVTSPVPDPTPDQQAGHLASGTAFVTFTGYDFQTGLVTSTTDANGKTTTNEYLDPLDRITKESRPDGGSTSYFYDRALNAGIMSDYVRTRTALDSARSVESYQFFDGLGRPSRSFLNEGGSPAVYLTKDTEYDSMGRVSKVSNPYRSGGWTDPAGINPSGRWTTTVYEALGRVRTETTPDGAFLTTSYAGNTTTVTDQHDPNNPAAPGRSRKSETDALGRLAAVYEDPDGLNYPTVYTYDVLGNLRTVTQATAQATQTRTFVYDSFSRLTSATNPESGTAVYTYDNNGNLLTKTDARGTTATYGYDQLNRNITVIYTLGGGAAATPDITRYYDNPAQGANGLGHLWKSQSLLSTLTTIDQYDETGRAKQQTQKFWVSGDWGQGYTTQLTYDLAGNVKSQFYPSGHAVTYNYDAAGRLGDNGAQSAFTGNLGDATTRVYVSGITYDEFGGLRQEKFGTQTPLYHKLHYNVRGQLFDIRLSTVAWDADQWNWNRGAIINYYSSNYLWEGNPSTPAGPDNNGNLRRQQHWVPTDDAISSYFYTQDTYDYDQFNRLTSAVEVHGTPSGQSGQDFAQIFNYDRWGNRTINLSQSQNVPVTQYDFDKNDLQNTNRLYAPGDTAYPDTNDPRRRMRYDVAGNLVNDSYTGAGARTYDAENRMVSAQTGSPQSAIYTYDADGMRVKRNTASGEVWQVYGLSGELLAEYAANASPNFPQKEYGYRGGELLVTAAVNVAWGPPPTFTGPDPLSHGDPIKLEHLTDLRSAVNQLRQHVGLTSYDFTVDPDPQRNVTVVKADHIRQLRAALEDALTRLSLPTGGYFQPTLSENSSQVYAKDFQELRDQIKGAWGVGSGAADVRWLVTDQLGTPRMAVDRTGSLAGLGRHDYLPFGEELPAGAGGRAGTQGYDGNDKVRQKFTDKERDAETGLDYFIARYYSSVQGRFTSPDEFTGGPDEVSDSDEPTMDPLFYCELTNPQSLNKYQYAYNNPHRFVDPDGHQGIDWVQMILNSPPVQAGMEEAAKGAGKAIGNTYIGLENLNADFGISGAKHREPYQPSNEIQSRAMAVTEHLILFGGLLGGKGPANVMTADAEESAAVAAEAGNAERAAGAEEAGAAPRTARAARREAMRREGIPTSQQPSSQVSTRGGRQYTYNVPKPGGGTQTKIVTHQLMDRNHGPHFEAGRPKSPPRTDPGGRLRHTNDKTKVHYL